MNAPKRSWREDVKAFRERMGGLTEEKKAHSREQHKIQKSITDALKDGPKTVPEISQIAGMPSDQVLWYVMALKRYGRLVEAGQAGNYFRYGMRETPL